MKRDLSDLNAEQSRVFLDYFNAKLREKHGLPFGTEGEGRLVDSVYEADLSDWLSTTSGGSVHVTWRLRQQADGRLLSVEALCGVEVDEAEWEAAAQEFIGDVLTATVTQATEPFFTRRRYNAIASANLNGEYWIGGYRFAPLFPDDDSSLINAERVLVVDRLVSAIDSPHAQVVADAEGALAAAHLSLITGVGLYEPIHEHRWVLLLEAGDHRHERFPTQVLDWDAPRQMPEKGELCNLGAFEGSVFSCSRSAGDPFCCPTETRRILRGARNSPPVVQAAFDKCARLYQLALTLGRYYPTVRISYQWAAVEAITQTLGSGSFSSPGEFLRHYSDEESSELVQVIHGQVRSAHWHGGEFALGETDHRRDFLTNPGEHDRRHLFHEANRLIRTAIFRWVMEEVADNEAAEDADSS